MSQAFKSCGHHADLICGCGVLATTTGRAPEGSGTANPDRHVPWMAHLGSTALQCNGCHMLCAENGPCRCCESARADEAEVALARVRGERDRLAEEAQALRAWPKYNPERHAYFAPYGSKRVRYCPKTRGGCGQPCSLEHLCRCCETARADEAETAIQRVRETCEQQVKDRSGYSDDRHRFDLSYIDGFNDALDRVEQALDGGTS